MEISMHPLERGFLVKGFLSCRGPFPVGGAENPRLKNVRSNASMNAHPTLMKAYHIKQWDDLYETNETRKIARLSYYAKSNKLVGLGIGRTLQHPRGLEFLGVWQLLEALASHSERHQRGWLVRNGAPLEPADIASLLRLPEEPITAAIAHFSNPAIGWLPLEEFTGTLPGDSPGSVPPSENHRDTAGTISLRGGGSERRTEEREIYIKRERHNQQARACLERRKELEAIPDDERTEAQDGELATVRRTLREIQKKQAAGDFSPVSER
jgi:hypothetical protein